MNYRFPKVLGPIILVVLMVVSAFVPQLAHAQSNLRDPNQLLSMSIEDLMDMKVISGNRVEQSFDNLSTPLSVITAEDIHYSGLTSVADILRFTPGVDVLPLNRQFYAIGVHGLHDFSSDRTLTLINGRAADSPFFGGSEFYRLPVFVEDIDRIEIVRGPGGAAWGANAFTGVINIITKKPRDIPGVFASSTLNEFGDCFTHVRWADYTDNWSWKLSVGYEDVENSDDAGAGKMVASKRLGPLVDTSGYEARDFGRKLIVDSEMVYENDTNRLSYGLGYSHNRLGTFEYFGYFPTQNDNEFETARTFAKLETSYDDGTSAHLQWTGNFSDTSMPILAKWRTAENDLEYQINFSPWDNHQMSAGGNARLIRIRTKSSNPLQLHFERQHYDECFLGAFFIDRWDITPKWTLEAQVRGDYYSETNQELSTRISSLHTLNEEIAQTLRFSVARAFRSPLLLLRKANITAVPIPLPPGVPDPYVFNGRHADNLKNENILSLEVGYQQRVGQEVLLKVNGFYQKLIDMIGYQSDGADPLGIGRNFFVTDNGTNSDNGRNAQLYGAELQLEYRKDEHSISAWYAYNELQEHSRDQDMRAHCPAQNKAGLTWRYFIDNNWTFNTNYAYRDVTPIRFYKFLTKTTPVHHRLDLTIARKIADGHGELMFGVADLLNNTEGPHLTMGQITGYELPARTFFARLQLNF